MDDLFASSDEDGEQSLNINEDYAKSYNRFREKEVFQKLKDKYGEDVANQKMDQVEDDSDDETSEDESAEELTEDVEKDFFRTLSCLKSKDPRIYDGKTSFFSAKSSVEKPKKKKEKPMFLGDLERKVMTEKGGRYEEMDEFKPEVVTHQQELEEIKKSFKQNVSSDDDDDDEDAANDLLKKKMKTKEDIKKEESDYRKWLSGQKADLEEDPSAKNELKPLRDFWNNDQLDENEKFLRDFILNKGFKQNNETVEDSDESEDLSEDERMLKEQEEFEHKYNFRFEEPDQEFIKRYPRTIQDSMRQKETKRQKQRLEVKQRKEKEKERKREEIKQLKAMKRKEIMAKLDKLKKIAGSDDLSLNENDLEEDFDPEKYDKRMSEIFQNYDAVNAEGSEMEKPEFSDLESDLEEELEVENWDEWDGNNREVENSENDKSANLGETSRNQLKQEMIQATRKNSKKKSKFAEVLERKRPLFDPEDKTFEEYLDEYYGLEFEDLIGDLPCRFKYRKVVENDFGLSTDEVLAAPDRELNAWCSLRKTCQYRSEMEEKKEQMIYKSKGNNFDLKKKVLPSLFEEKQEESLQEEQEKKSSKSKKRRKKKKKGEVDHTESESTETQMAKKRKHSDGESTETQMKKKKKQTDGESTEIKIKKKKHSDGETTETQMKKKQTDGESTEIQTETKGNVESQSESTNKKKKRRKKKKDSSSIVPPLKKKKSCVLAENKSKSKVNAEYSMSDERLKAYGLNPKKLKKKIINSKMNKK